MESTHQLGLIRGGLQNEPLVPPVRTQDLREEHEHKGVDLRVQRDGGAILSVFG